MGQAWCKEKSTKAQDSKSPLDRVFLRCAHRIYPGLKEEGSVLGGATQRVTSSEIGYASSPPRGALTRGQSIDSVDRPFHPSDWVDVNLEVPVTPRTTSAMTNLTLDASIYPPATLTSTNSGGSNSNFAPVPPPRRKRKYRGRPLPPKPDEVTSSSFRDSRNSVQQPRLNSSDQMLKNRSHEKEIFEHKINGTGRIIPSTVVAASGSNREKSSRESEKPEEKKMTRPKNSSTVSLPNYSELEVTNDSPLGDDDGKIKIHKITAAASLPALITSGVLEDLKKSDNEKKAKRATEEKRRDDRENEDSVDEVDYSLEKTKNRDAIDSSLMLEAPRLTSTPIKSSFENDSRSPTTVGGWFLHQDRVLESDHIPITSSSGTQEPATALFYDCQKDSRSDIFFEAEEDQLDHSEDNHDAQKRNEKVEESGIAARTSLRRTLSNESEPFDSCEEKELRESGSTSARSNSRVKLLGRAISDESLPEEMLENETDFFEDKKAGSIDDANEKSGDKKVSAESTRVSGAAKTPPPSPEPKIKPEIFDNDHSILLKVLRDEAEESNLSSMTPSLTELEAALSDMLEREDEDHEAEEAREDRGAVKTNSDDSGVERFLEKPIEPKIVPIEVETDTKNPGVPVSLKNILEVGEKSSREEKSTVRVDDDSTMTEIDLTSRGEFGTEGEKKNDLVEIPIDETSRGTCPGGEPPEKPSRLHHSSHEEKPMENSGNVPTPPKRRNRYGGYSSSILADGKSLERIPTPDDPYPNDRLI